MQSIIAEQFERAKELLRTHSEQHHAIAQLLMDREVIYADDVKEILGPRPWESRADELLNDEQNTAFLNEAEKTESEKTEENNTEDKPSDENTETETVVTPVEDEKATEEKTADKEEK